MYNIYVLFTVLPGALAASLVPGIPACANTCLEKFHTPNHIEACGLTDVKCICNNDNFISSISCCIAATCNADDQATAIKFAHKTCDALVPGRLPFKAQCANAQQAPPSSTQAAAPTSVVVATIQSIVSVPVTVAVPATITSVLLQTSLVTNSQLILLTSIVTNAAAISTEVVTSSSIDVLTSVVDSQVLETVTSALSLPAFPTSTASAPDLLSAAASTTPEIESTPSTSEGPSLIKSPSSTVPIATSAAVTNLGNESKATTSQKLSVGQKFGIAVAVITAIAILAAVPLFILRRKRKLRNEEMREAHDPMSARTPRAVPLYPNTGGYRDVFGGPITTITH